jgi:hypothetical protein
MQVITNLQATIKERLKKDVLFTKVNDNEFTYFGNEIDINQIAFFAMRENFKVRKKGNTLTLNVSRETLAK